MARLNGADGVCFPYHIGIERGGLKRAASAGRKSTDSGPNGGKIKLLTASSL